MHFRTFLFFLVTVFLVASVGCQKKRVALSKPSLTQTQSELEMLAPMIVDACDPAKVASRSLGKSGEGFIFSFCAANMKKLEQSLFAGEIKHKDLARIIIYYREFRPQDGQ